MSSRFVFWPLISNELHPIEKDCYEYYFHEMKWFPDIYIYLSKDPEIAHGHIQNRHQAGDDSVNLDYLRDLNDRYNQMFEHSVPTSKKYIIDANRTESEIHQEICMILSKNEVFVCNSYRQEM